MKPGFESHDILLDACERNRKLFQLRLLGLNVFGIFNRPVARAQLLRSMDSRLKLEYIRVFWASSNAYYMSIAMANLGWTSSILEY